MLNHIYMYLLFIGDLDASTPICGSPILIPSDLVASPEQSEHSVQETQKQIEHTNRFRKDIIYLCKKMKQLKLSKLNSC